MRAEVVGPADGVVERPAVFGEVEVLDRQAALVVEGVESCQHRARSRRPRAGRRRGAARIRGSPDAAARDRRARAARAGRSPQSATCPVSTSSRRPGTAAWISRTDSIEFTTRRRAARAARPAIDATSAPLRPTSPAHRRGAGVAHHPGCGFGYDVGHPTGSTSDAGSTSTSTSMCSNPISPRAAIALGLGLAPRT